MKMQRRGSRLRGATSCPHSCRRRPPLGSQCTVPLPQTAAEQIHDQTSDFSGYFSPSRRLSFRTVNASILLVAHSQNTKHSRLDTSLSKSRDAHFDAIAQRASHIPSFAPVQNYTSATYITFVRFRPSGVWSSLCICPFPLSSSPPGATATTRAGKSCGEADGRKINA